MKEDKKLKGLCKECTHRNSCEDAKRYLEMAACSNDLTQEGVYWDA